MTKTLPATFRPCNDANQPLFAVQPGIPLQDALECVCCLLESAEALAVLTTGGESPEQLGYACSSLIEMAKATLHACIEGMHKKNV